MTYVVCYSGGHSSALVAIEAVRRYGRDNVILLNHDISSKVEHADIKRFKNEVADCLGVPITYANHPDFENMTPLAISRAKSGFSDGVNQTFCTYYLKTIPFMKWLKDEFPISGETRKDRHLGAMPIGGQMQEDVKVLYGFDGNELHRIQRRNGVMITHGYHTEFPLYNWPRTIEKTEDIGIARPRTYSIYKHANCKACLKAGRQHWYCIFCLEPELWEEAKQAESEIGHSIIKGVYLEELEPQFIEMRDRKHICPSDKGNSASFWAKVNATLPDQTSMFPCECAI